MKVATCGYRSRATALTLWPHGDIISVHSVKSGECWPARVLPSAGTGSGMGLPLPARLTEAQTVPAGSSVCLQVFSQREVVPRSSF